MSALIYRSFFRAVLLYLLLIHELACTSHLQYAQYIEIALNAIRLATPLKHMNFFCFGWVLACSDGFLPYFVDILYKPSWLCLSTFSSATCISLFCIQDVYSLFDFLIFYRNFSFFEIELNKQGRPYSREPLPRS